MNTAKLAEENHQQRQSQRLESIVLARHSSLPPSDDVLLFVLLILQSRISWTDIAHATARTSSSVYLFIYRPRDQVPMARDVAGLLPGM